MHHTLVIVAGIIGLSLILSVTIYIQGRLRIEQQRSLQKLIDSGASAEALQNALGIASSGTRDLRRGILLLAVGLAWSGVTYFIGGPAWMMGAVPMVLGLACLLLWKLDGKVR